MDVGWDVMLYLYVQALLLVAMALHLLWAESWRCWIFIIMVGNMWGGVRMLNFLDKTNTSTSWVITTQCTIRPCLSEVAPHGHSPHPVELLILVTHELLSCNYHSGLLRSLLMLLLLLFLHHGLLYHGLHRGLLYHHGLLRGHAILHVRLMVPTRLLLNFPACTNINAGYTYR